MRTVRWVGFACALFVAGCAGADGGSTTEADAGGTKEDTGGACSCAAKECGDDGCGNACGTCAKGFLCNSNRCDLDPTSVWMVTIAKGKIAMKTPAGGDWDTAASPPDPYVCTTFSDGNYKCTAYVDNTYTPVWNTSYGPFAVTELRKGFDAELWDDDYGADDVICPKQHVAINDFYLKAGTVSFMCLPTASVTVNLIPM